MIRYLLLVSPLLLLINSCSQKETVHEEKQFINITTKDVHQCNIELEKAIIEDYFSPPIASRIYVYPNIAAYECLRTDSSNYQPLSHFYSELAILPNTLSIHQRKIAAIYAFYTVGKELVYSSSGIDTALIHFTKQLQTTSLDTTWKAARSYGEHVAKVIVQWSQKDGYKEMRSASHYELINEPNKWIPTPPDYSDALEPHWGTLRSFTLDSAAQFKPAPPTEFSLDTTSLFYQELMEVYQAVKALKEDEPAIAKFWDCNPIVPKHQGHGTFSEKKLTPGGHWMNIGRMAMKEQKIQSLEEVSKDYVLLSIAIHDAFISCWKEKYTSHYIRPVTVIQKHIDPDWTPILLTPNFPEYPSGHSVVSAAAATILTDLFGDQYAFTDSTEVPFGMPPRSFSSFYKASNEAAISRLYGGIHFRPAIDNGIIQGRKVGNHVLTALQLEK